MTEVNVKVLKYRVTRTADKAEFLFDLEFRIGNVRWVQIDVPLSLDSLLFGQIINKE